MGNNTATACLDQGVDNLVDTRAEYGKPCSNTTTGPAEGPDSSKAISRADVIAKRMFGTVKSSHPIAVGARQLSDVDDGPAGVACKRGARCLRLELFAGSGMAAGLFGGPGQSAVVVIRAGGP